MARGTSLSLRMTTGTTADNTDGTHESVTLHGEPSSNPNVASATLSALFPKRDGNGLEPGVYSLSLSRIGDLPAAEPVGVEQDIPAGRTTGASDATPAQIGTDAPAPTANDRRGARSV